MPLDRVNGEPFDGLQGLGPYVLVAPRALADMTQLLVTYTAIEGTKFKRKVEKRRPLFDDAVAEAILSFKAKGALSPVRFDEDDVMVQVYPQTRKVAVVFQRRIAGVEHFVPLLYPRGERMPQPVIETLLKAAIKGATLH